MCFLISSCTATDENTNQVAIVDENPGILSQIKHGLLVTGATAFDLTVVAGGALAYTSCTGLASGAGPLAPIGGSFCSAAIDTVAQALRPTAMDDYSLTKTPIGAQAITIVNIAKGLSGSDLKNLGQATINAGVTFGKNIAYDAAATKVCTEIARIGNDYDSVEVLKRLKAFFPVDQELTKEFLKKWATQSCKSMTIQGMNNLEQTAVKSYEADSKKNAAFKKYKARCKAEGRKPVQRRTWQKKYDSLEIARAVKKAKAEANAKAEAEAKAKAKAKAEAEAKAKAEAKKKEKQIVEEKKTYQIFVSDGQKTYVIDVDKDMSLHDLGKVIKKTTGNQYDYFSSSGRRHLFDKTTVETAGIGKGNTLNLQIRLCGGGCDRPDGRGSSRDGGVPKKKYTGPQHKYDDDIKSIESRLKNGRMSYDEEVDLRTELQWKLKYTYEERFKLLREDYGEKFFDDKIREIRGYGFVDHRGAMVHVVKQMDENSIRLGQIVQTKRDITKISKPSRRIRKNILDDSKIYQNGADNVDRFKVEIIKLSKKSTGITLDLLRNDGRNLHRFKSEVETHHGRNNRELNNISPNFCRQISYEAYEDFTHENP
jgi:hypothetical protein